VLLPARGVLEVRSVDDEHVIALFNPLVLAFFSRPPSADELTLIAALAEQGRVENIAGGMLFVVARKNASGGIEPRVREFFEQLVRENSGHFGASAVVVLMKGFGGALMRSFLTGLLLLTRKRKMLQIFGSVEEACRWLAPLHALDAESLFEAYEKAAAKVAKV